jgi:general secretion pathway protein I
VKSATRASRSGGFTLLEALLALTIFAISFALVLDTLARGLRNARTAADLTQAALWAQNRLDSLGVTEKLEPAAESGRFDPRFRYDLRIEKFEPVDGPTAPDGGFPVQLFRIELVVYWGTENGQRSERFVTVKSRLKEGAFF